MAVKFVPIKPDKLDENELLVGLRDAVKEEVKEADKQFQKTYRTFRHKPSFDQDYSESTREIEGETSTTGDGSRDNPYPFVAKGTAVRYATMTPDFAAKTTPRVIGSSGGRGGVAYINKNRPRPGIKSREFEEEIAKSEKPKFPKRAQASLDKAAKRSKHAI